MNKNDGKEYEEFVRSIQQYMIDAEGLPGLTNIVVERDKKIKDRNGILRQFDVYWEFKMGGILYRSVIECKDYASAVTIDKIDALIGKASDIPGLRLIYATKTGYQSGAKTKAEQHKIDLLIVRKGENEDWVSDDGTPLIKIININMVMNVPPSIISFDPSVDLKWLELQSNLTPDDLRNKSILAPNNEIFIINEVTGIEYSLPALQGRLISKIPNITFGRGTYKEELTDSYLEVKGSPFRMKISGFKIEYIHHEPITNNIVIDISGQLLGIVQNYASGDKKMIFNNGMVK